MIGVAGCAVLAVALPLAAVIIGAVVIAAGAVLYWLRRTLRSRTSPTSTN